MDSAKAILILMGLIVGLNLGLPRSRAPKDGLDPSSRSDQSDLADEGSSQMAIEVRPSDSATASDPSSKGSDARAWSRALHRGRAPISRPPNGGSVTDPEFQDPPSQELSSLVHGLESASSFDEQAQWADRIAARGGAAAVEALIQAVIRAGLDRRSFEEAENLREAFKGFSTEEDMTTLAMSLVQVQDLDLIEAIVETLARGARASTVEQLVRLHEEGSMPPATRAVLRWAIERIRNPEASDALARWVAATDQPELAEAGVIALASLRSQASHEPVGSP